MTRKAGCMKVRVTLKEGAWDENNAFITRDEMSKQIAEALGETVVVRFGEDGEVVCVIGKETAPEPLDYEKLFEATVKILKLSFVLRAEPILSAT